MFSDRKQNSISGQENDLKKYQFASLENWKEERGTDKNERKRKEREGANLGEMIK